MVFLCQTTDHIPNDGLRRHKYYERDLLLGRVDSGIDGDVGEVLHYLAEVVGGNHAKLFEGGYFVTHVHV